MMLQCIKFDMASTVSDFLGFKANVLKRLNQGTCDPFLGCFVLIIVMSRIKCNLRKILMENSN